VGVFRVSAKLFKIGAERRIKEVIMTVDTGATYPVIPRSIADELRLEPTQTQTFRLADGRRVRRRLAWAGIAVDGRKSPTLVVLGGAKDPPLLGAFALEGLGLEVDPVARRLRPAELHLP
jgi:clan AA aspartic protease